MTGPSLLQSFALLLLSLSIPASAIAESDLSELIAATLRDDNLHTVISFWMFEKSDYVPTEIFVTVGPIIETQHTSRAVVAYHAVSLRTTIEEKTAKSVVDFYLSRFRLPQRLRQAFRNYCTAPRRMSGFERKLLCSSGRCQIFLWCFAAALGFFECRLNTLVYATRFPNGRYSCCKLHTAQDYFSKLQSTQSHQYSLNGPSLL